MVVVRIGSLDGKPLVRDILRTSATAREALVQRLPDLVVHWDDAVFSRPLRIRGMKFEPVATGTKFTGQHALDGFSIFKGEWNGVAGDVLPARDLGLLITRNLVGPQTASAKP